MKLQDFNFFRKSSKSEISTQLLKQWLKKLSTPINDLDHLVFSNYLILNYVIQHTQTHQRQKHEKFRDAYFRSDIQKKSYPKQAIVKVSSDLGYGVVSKELIFPKTYLGEYTGIVRRYIPSFDKSNPYLVRYPIKLGLLKPLIIDASKHGNHTRFYNHSNQPNAQLVSVVNDGIFKMIVISNKQIQNQSQILIDYGKLYWKQIGKSPNDF